MKNLKLVGALISPLFLFACVEVDSDLVDSLTPETETETEAEPQILNGVELNDESVVDVFEALAFPNMSSFLSPDVSSAYQFGIAAETVIACDIGDFTYYHDITVDPAQISMDFNDCVMDNSSANGLITMVTTSADNSFTKDYSFNLSVTGAGVSETILGSMQLAEESYSYNFNITDSSNGSWITKTTTDVDYSNTAGAGEVIFDNDSFVWKIAGDGVNVTLDSTGTTVYSADLLTSIFY